MSTVCFFVFSINWKPFLFILLIFQLLAHPAIAISPHPLLLLVSFDGFRWDYLSRTLTPNLWALSSAGVRFSKGLRSQMITVTASNHYSIVTGLFEESHGIVGNSFYDPKFGDYNLWDANKTEVYQASKLGKWYNGEPLWITNQKKSGHFSGSLYWPSGDANISGVYPKDWKTWQDYGNLTIWKKEFEKILGWFRRPVDPINFGLWYISQPDEIEHLTGAFSSSNTTRCIQELDKLVGYIVTRLKETGLYNSLNLILTTDHGHAERKYPENSVPLMDYLKDIPEFAAKKLIFSSGGLTLIDGTSEAVENIFQTLRTKIEHDYKHGEVTVMRKRDFPNFRYHWTNSSRVADILLLPKIGHAIEWYLNGSELAKEKHKIVADHGYYPEHKEMRGFLLMHGPAFRKHLLVDTEIVENIDLYPLMCRVLKLDPAPNNASFGRIRIAINDAEDKLSMLENFLLDNKAKLVIIFAMVVPSVLFLCYLLACMMTRQHGGSSRTPGALAAKMKRGGKSTRGYERLANSGGTSMAGNSSVFRNGQTDNFESNSLQNGVKIQQGEKPLLLLGNENLDSMSENEL